MCASLLKSGQWEHIIKDIPPNTLYLLLSIQKTGALIPSKETTTKESTASRPEGNIVPTQCASKMVNIKINGMDKLDYLNIFGTAIKLISRSKANFFLHILFGIDFRLLRKILYVVNYKLREEEKVHGIIKISPPPRFSDNETRVAGGGGRQSY